MTPFPFASLPNNDSKGTAQQRILDLEAAILLYSYNPSSEIIVLWKRSPSLPYDKDLHFSMEPRGIYFDNPLLDQFLFEIAPVEGDSLIQGGFLLEPYKTHCRVGTIFRRKCPRIQTYFLFENNLLVYSLKRRIGKTTRR